MSIVESIFIGVGLVICAIAIVGIFVALVCSVIFVIKTIFYNPHRRDVW